MGNRRGSTIQLLHRSTITHLCRLRSHQSTNERVRNARHILPVYTCMHHIRSLCTYAYALMHLFMEDSGESTGQMRGATTKSR